ncbi:MAG TPA: hypothetical protein VMV68_04540 [Spirochaetia bacterium]|nr:hypothetical protein [Spirochaetia bacterium]
MPKPAAIAKTALALTAALLCASCIGVDEKITINADGSGQLDLVYRISTMVSDIGPSAGQPHPIPLPMTEDAFRSAVAAVNGLTLSKLSSQLTPSDLVISSVVAFTDPTLLSLIGQGASAPRITFSTTGGRTTFRETIYQGNPGGVDPDTLSFIKSAFQGYLLRFTLSAPFRITGVNVGTISQDQRTAVYTTNVVDAIQSKSPLVWEVRW